MPHDDMYTLYYGDDGGEVWRCRYCANAKPYKVSGSTSGPAGHLTDYHGIPGGSARDVQAKNVQRSLEQGFATARANPQKRRRPDTETIEQDKLEALWVRCVVSCNLSFRLVANTEFRAFVKYLNEDAESLLGASHTDVRRWIFRQFDGLKDSVIIVLSKAQSKIHICCDLWTSPNSIAILGVTAQFINSEGQLKSLVLALKEVNGEHTGENLSKYVMEVIRDYDIQGNLGYFVMDNAENNDTMMTSLSSSLRREFRLHYDPKHFRLRCQGHIINLAVKSFLFVTDEENIEEDKETNTMLVTIKEIEEWRKRGPLGKLHNFVVFLAQSTQRLHHFLEFSLNHRIPRDNSTRWNSWYMMLDVAYNLRQAIEDFMDEYATADLLDDRLDDNEWEIIEKIKTFLARLSMSTKACESKQSTLDLVLPCMDFILGHFEDAKNKYTDDPIFAPMLNSGWAKLVKYYRASDRTPAYIAALILHPSRKWRWVERHWKQEWIAPAKAMMKDFWEDRYKPATLSNTPPASSLKPQNEFLQWLEDDDNPELQDEYLAYCAEPQVPGVKQGYTWWLEARQQKRFPNLSKMAIDILSIPAMSADPERLFSGAKITITDRRNRFGIRTIQALECLKSWLNIIELQEDDAVDEDDLLEKRGASSDVVEGVEG